MRQRMLPQSVMQLYQTAQQHHLLQLRLHRLDLKGFALIHQQQHQYHQQIPQNRGYDYLQRQ